MPEADTGADNGYRVGNALGTPVSGEEAGWLGWGAVRDLGCGGGPKSGLEVARGKTPMR